MHVEIRKELITKAQDEQQFFDITGTIVASTISWALDGDKFEDVEGVIKTIIGIGFEKRFLRAFDLPKNKQQLDTNIAGIDVDIKVTVGANWMIPPECVGEWCLLAQVNVPERLYSLGTFHAVEDHLTKGGNRDCKRSVSKFGKRNIGWLIRNLDFE